MAELLTLTRFGNPVLRKPARALKPEEIMSTAIQSLIENMTYTLVEKEYGVGIAAPQVGESVALSVIGIKPTPNRPELTPFDTVLINPVITKRHGMPTDMWEGCVSCGTGNDIIFAKVPRYESVDVEWLDETAQSRSETISGFVAQVVQHETDHLNGVLFVDHVADSTSFMMVDEYRKRILGKDEPPS